MLGLVSLNAVLQETNCAYRTLRYNFMFEHGKLKSANTFDPFTHVLFVLALSMQCVVIMSLFIVDNNFSPSTSFSPSIWNHLVLGIFNVSQTCNLI
jgi:hypothetical protein